MLTVRTQGVSEPFQLPLGDAGASNSIFALLPNDQIITIEGRMITLLRSGVGQ